MKNRKFGEKSKFWSKIEILVKNRKLGQKAKIYVQIYFKNVIRYYLKLRIRKNTPVPLWFISTSKNLYKILSLWFEISSPVVFIEIYWILNFFDFLYFKYVGTDFEQKNLMNYFHFRNFREFKKMIDLKTCLCNCEYSTIKKLFFCRHRNIGQK